MFETYILYPLLSHINNNGESNAFCIAEKFYTYQELGQYISKIRKAIQEIQPTIKNVGLVANDDIETYASIFALWLEGLAYVPLHPNQPTERNQEIITQASIELVINSNSKIPFPDIKTIESNILSFNELELLPKPTSEQALAYILFTSGSTGKPKGVPIMRLNVGAFLEAFFAAGFTINSLDRCLQCFDLTFDVSVQAFLTPLTRGACTYTIPHDQIKYSYVFGLLDDHKLTFSVMAPSMLRYLRPYFDELDVRSMRYCILTAEASPVDLLEEWSNCIPNAELYDFYGPTEATIYCTYYKFHKEGYNKQLNGMLSIGKPMNNLTSIILDEDEIMVGSNIKGELCISGDQLTPGYWNNPEKTRSSFINLNLNGTIRRFYKTGDLCYIDDEGDIMYAGRLDYQVKIQGYRIELGEIEHHARESINGRNAIAVTFENKTGNNEIALFVEGESIDTITLLTTLKQKLPQYMLPTKIIARTNFPLNSNGKVDRNMLKKIIPL